MIGDQLQGKTVVFIGVKFYNYNVEIIRRLEHYGARVHFFYERDTTLRYGVYNRLLPHRLDNLQKKHYKSIANKVKGVRIDYLLVIRGHKMPICFMQELKQANPGMQSIMYQWDSEANSPFVNVPPHLNVIPFFDRHFSFDFRDVETYPFLRYAPTFSTPEFEELFARQEQETYDLLYFGNYLPERYEGLLAFEQYAKQHNLTLRFFLYMHWRHFLIEKLKGAPLQRRYFSFKMLSRSGYFDLFRQARAIVDVSNRGQTGMAMRVLDALVAGKKVITTNPWIVKDENHEPAQVAVVDLDNIALPEDFFQQPRPGAQPDFSVDRWIYNVFFS